MVCVPNEDLYAEWGRRLKALREEKNWTQAQVASRAEITQQALSLLERGANSAGDEVRLRLAAVFGVKVEDLFPYPARA